MEKTFRNHYWTVIPRIPVLFSFLGIIGFGLLAMLFETTNSVGVGVIIAGVVIELGWKWEYHEIK